MDVFIWTIPYDTKQHVGHLDLLRAACMNLEDFGDMSREFPHASLSTALRRLI